VNRRIKKLWTDALESGKYTQCTARLCNDTRDRHCCLGVLSELYQAEHPEDARAERHLKTKGGLHPNVMAWAGLVEADPEVVYDLDELDEPGTTLSQLNDDRQLEFDEIAAVIREQL
jgi:hypothetical protein